MFISNVAATKVQRHSCCKPDLGICGIHIRFVDFTHENLGEWIVNGFTFFGRMEEEENLLITCKSLVSIGIYDTFLIQIQTYYVL